jgi:hypothetical protein
LVILDKHIFGFFRYRKAVFPTLEQASKLVAELGLNQVLHFPYVFGPAVESRNLIRCRPVSTVFIDLRKSLDDIFAAMQNHNCRRAIHRAEKILDRVRISHNTQESFDDFLTMYNNFADAKGVLPKMSRHGLELYTATSDVFVLYFDDQPFIGHVWLRDEESKRVVHMFLGNRRLEETTDRELHNNLNRYLHWHEIQFYKSQGMETYDFGGIGPDNPYETRFNKFKMSFGGTILSEYLHTYARPALIAKLAIGAYERVPIVRYTLAKS